MQQDAYDRMAHESARMNADVAALLAAREAEALRHAEAVHETKREMLELRQSLEHTFRKTLADAEQAHQARAFGALGAGAKDALLTNAKLKEELSLQAIGMKNLDLRHERQGAEIVGVRADCERLKARATRERARAARGGRARDLRRRALSLAMRSSALRASLYPPAPSPSPARPAGEHRGPRPRDRHAAPPARGRGRAHGRHGALGARA